MTNEEIYKIVHEENLGVDINSVEPRNTDPNQECYSVVPELTDQGVYDKEGTSISLSQEEASVKVGGVFKLYPSIEPKTANMPALIWETSDLSVASVTQEGIVTINKKGVATITATDAYNGKVTAKCEITVIDKGVASIEVSGTLSVVKGQTTTLTATVKPEDADNKVVEWVSMSPGVATVSNEGVVTGVAAGKAIIKAIATDGSKTEGQAEVEVTPILVSSITLNPTEKTINKTNKFTPSVTFTPTGADNKELEWSSDHPEFASVNSKTGEITGVAVGSAVITAKTKDGSNKTATCTVTVEAAKVTKITLSETSKTLDKGATFNLTATVEPEIAENKGITWSSEADATASVTPEGLVTAKAAGTTNIVATAKDGSGITTKCSVTVNAKKVTGITLDAQSKTVTKGDTFKLTATVTPTDADNKQLDWSSNATDKATVDTSGNVTTKATGSAIITAKSKDGSNKQATCNVTINPKLVTGITLSESTKSLERGGTFKLTATIAPTDADNKQVEWSSNASDKASVDVEGNVTAKAVGEAVITAKSKDGSNKTATCTVTVGPKKVTGITVDPATKSIAVNAKFTLTANVVPADADNKGVTWSSGTPANATVNAETGEVTGVKAGEAIITATAKDGSGKTGTCTVTVTGAAK